MYLKKLLKIMNSGILRECEKQFCCVYKIIQVIRQAKSSKFSVRKERFLFKTIKPKRCESCC